MEDKTEYEVEEKAIQVVSSALPVATIDDVIYQVELIQKVMKRVMKKDEHYGVIPGTQKPTLLKSGAEKLINVFRFAPRYTAVSAIEQENFIMYRVKCELYHINTSNFVGEGEGTCNSKETKYRYRNENTWRPVPEGYWETRDQSLIGIGNSTIKKDGKWYISKKVENTEVWDQQNTILKMAEKRALVAATLNATAASDIFTQDIEDMNMKGKTDKKPPAMPKPTAPKTTTKAGDNGGVVDLDDKIMACLEKLAGDELEAQIKVFTMASAFVDKETGEIKAIKTLAGTSEKWKQAAYGKLKKLAEIPDLHIKIAEQWSCELHELTPEQRDKIVQPAKKRKRSSNAKDRAIIEPSEIAGYEYGEEWWKD